MERTEEMTRASAPAKVLDGSYIDWAAIFGGGVVAVAIASVFAGFGAALGLSTISAERGEGSFDAMVIVSAIWIVVSLVASYLAGGYIAGRMRRRVDQVGAEEVTVRDGINGLVVWGLGIVATVFLLGAALSTTISAVGSVASAAGAAAGTVATTAGSVVGGIAEGALSAAGAVMPADALKDQLAYVGDSLLRPAQVTTGTATPEAVAAQTAGILGNVALTGEISDAERNYLVSAVVQATAASPAEAATRVDAAVATAQQARAGAEQLATDARAEVERLAAEAEELARNAAETARISAILSAFILAASAIIAAAAAYVGAIHGGRHRDEGRIFGGLAYRS